YVIDGAVKRHVVNRASLNAWHLTITTMKAATLDAVPAGPDWLLTPFLMQAVGAPEIYAIDLAPATAAGSEGTGDPTDLSNSESADAVPVSPNTGGDDGAGGDGSAGATNADGGSADSSGCGVAKGGTRTKDGGSAFAIFGLALGIAAARKRRKSGSI
ncbi:MAG: hypothetical protein ACREJX_15545, partial [Polyangiaceae bacterium]